MKTRLVAIVLGLTVAGVPALARIAYTRSPSVAPTAAAKKPSAKQTHAAAPRSREDADPLADLPSFSSEAVGWQLVEDAKTGARLGVPEKLTPHVGPGRSGTRWSSAHGQIQIETFSFAEASLPALFDEEKRTARRQPAISTYKPDSFVVVGVQGLKNFVVRADARGSEVRGVTILYDQATAGTMDRVAINVANAFVAFPDPNAMPAPGLRRPVEYGSAIVIGSDGDLITTVHNVEDCQVITVPPFGHAERISENRANDLALIRLNGARNLAPAPLADAGSQTGDVMLVGVADPLAQSGSPAPASVPARLSGQSVEPVPKLGFSGAAVVDGNGRLLGMLDLRPSIVAGSGGVGAQGAALVPVETIRAFIQAQHIKPASVPANSDINQSVLRVICVRK
jgi:S1-C subfamily serine protease